MKISRLRISVTSALTDVRKSGRTSQIQPGSMPEAKIEDPPAAHAAWIGSARAAGAVGGCKEAGELLAHETDATKAVPDVLKDPDAAFCTVRIPVMVMAVRKDLEAASRPRMFSNLAEDRFEGRVTMGDPLKSGTNFSWVFFKNQGSWNNQNPSQNSGRPGHCIA